LWERGLFESAPHVVLHESTRCFSAHHTAQRTHPKPCNRATKNTYLDYSVTREVTRCAARTLRRQARLVMHPPALATSTTVRCTRLHTPLNLSGSVHALLITPRSRRRRCTRGSSTCACESHPVSRSGGGAVSVRSASWRWCAVSRPSTAMRTARSPHGCSTYRRSVLVVRRPAHGCAACACSATRSTW
jgi:hypothetical protein